MIRFGPAGNSDSFYRAGYKATVQMPEYLKRFGLNAYEYSCGRGIHVSQNTAVQIGEAARREDIALSVHAPYFINFANPDADKRARSRKYLEQSLELAGWLGARRIAFHAGAQGGLPRRDAIALIREEILRVLAFARESGLPDISLCPETMGKRAQIGDLCEILEICRADDALIPTIDFGHLNALSQGGLRAREDFAALLDRVGDALGADRLNRIHVHFSHIEYGRAGEKRHLTFADSSFGPDFLPLAQEMKARGMEPVVICESQGTQAEDAAEMKRIWESE